jgi:hypothetical protein
LVDTKYQYRCEVSTSMTDFLSQKKTRPFRIGLPIDNDISSTASCYIIMPTLVKEVDEVDENSSSSNDCAFDTAGTSGFLWLKDNLADTRVVVPVQQQQQNIMDPSRNSNITANNATNNNDSTLSESYFESTLRLVGRQKTSRTVVGVETQYLLQERNKAEKSSSSQMSDREGKLHRPYTDVEISNDGSISNSVSRTYDEDDFVFQLKNSSDQNVIPVNTKEASLHHSLNSLDSIESKTNKNHRQTLPKHRQRKDLRMGPNEKLYMEQYASTIENRKININSKHPGLLRDYLKLSKHDQLIEQQFVSDLLQRLRINGGKCNKENVLQHSTIDEHCLNEKLNYRFQSSIRNSSDGINGEVSSDNIETSNTETSMNLLSPITQPQRNEVSAQQKIDFSPFPTDQVTNISMELLSSSQNFPDMDDRSDGLASSVTKVSSVEVTRAVSTTDKGYDSPIASPRFDKKRYASTSGKRGADMVRLRLDDELEVPSPSKFLINAVDRLSMGDNVDSMFPSSQSPIAPVTSPYSPMSTNNKEESSIESIEADISFGNHQNNSSSEIDDYEFDHATNGQPPYDNDSLVETTMLQDKRVRWDFDHKLTKDAPTDVRLRYGETLRYPKLSTERRKGPTLPLTQSFPDPYRFYDDKMQQRLVNLYSWILQRDQSTTLTSQSKSGVILSITEQQIADIILKLHLDFPLLDNRDVGSTMCSPLIGKTLIVTRSKDELEMWRRSFREGSALSIVNHASMPTAERKNPSCSKKLVHYDVVLTTYDALKSSDIAIKVDNTTGFAITTADGISNDGWYTAFQSQKQDINHAPNNNVNTCKTLSALHKLNWGRMILVDILGRKGYVTKSDTARVYAIRALNADTRLVFLTRSVSATNDGKKNCPSIIMNGIDALIKSDRSALTSLSYVLRREASETDVATIHQEFVIDFDDSKTFTNSKTK